MFLFIFAAIVIYGILGFSKSAVFSWQELPAAHYRRLFVICLSSLIITGLLSIFINNVVVLNLIAIPLLAPAVVVVMSSVKKTFSWPIKPGGILDLAVFFLLIHLNYLLLFEILMRNGFFHRASGLLAILLAGLTTLLMAVRLAGKKLR